MVDTVVIKSETPPEDQAHIDAMVAKAEGTTQVKEDNVISGETDRPQWLPEKFKSPEDLAKAYSELESKLGGKKEQPQAEPEAKPEAKPQESLEITPDTQVAEELSSKGLNLQDFSSEFAQKGELSTESYEKLAKAGYPRDVVDNYIAGQNARAQLFEADVKNSIGGDKAFTEMVEWAKANVSPNELSTYNEAVSSGNPDKAKLAVLGMYQKFSSARPAEPNLVSGNSKGGTTDAYESMAQMKEDMKNPLYKSDPAFRSKVQAKLARSNIM